MGCFKMEFDVEVQCCSVFSKIIVLFLSATSTETKFIQHTSSTPTHSVRSSSDTSPRVHSLMCQQKQRPLLLPFVLDYFVLKNVTFLLTFFFRILKGSSFSLYFFLLRRGTVKIKQHPQRFLQNDPNPQTLSSQLHAQTTTPPPRKLN